MAEISRTALFGKLNPLAYKSIESATMFCKLRGNPYVELAHWIQQILQLQDSDLHHIIRHFEINPSTLAKDVVEELDRLPRGATSISDLSAHVEESVERGWVYGSLLFGDSSIRTGHLIVGILKTSGLRNVVTRMSPEFARIKLDDLTDRFAGIVKGSPEEALPTHDGTSRQVAQGTEPMAPAAMGKQEALARFSTDLTAKARSGEMDPIVGRDAEIRQMMDVLMRRRQNNPILTGEAGVGKTAVVEGFAQRIARGDVPQPLREVTLRTLDVGLLQAGASVKGEFENRLRQVIEEVQSSPKPIILFIDEAHTLIGAGGAAGTGDAANLLKPALARGTLRTIAATTWSEYKKYIEKDPALTRRFQVIKVDEPAEDRAVLMMRTISSMLEKHHQVQVLDEALDAAVRLSSRYIPDRQLPDKAVSLIDTACARVAISQYAMPPEVESCRRHIEALETELEILGRETATGTDHTAREAAITESLKTERDRLRQLEARWAEEQELVASILAIRARLRTSGDGKIGPPGGKDKPDSPAAGDKPGRTSAQPEKAATEPEQGKKDPRPDRESLLAELRTLQRKLDALQGESPLILPCVDAKAVSSVVAHWTGIPVGGMVKNEIEAVLNLTEKLRQRVIGQDQALEAITRRIKTSRARLENPHRPIAVMLLLGPSGVGKTETAIALAETLYGGEQNLITINMSEFQEAHTVSTLKGSPPGYVGYGEGGVLTEAVRRRPYSIVLLDEVEKAHHDVHEIFFQVFDRGQMEDAEGRLIDFKNTIILLTSNVGSELIMDLCKDPRLMPEHDAICKALRKPLLKTFPAALLGRLVVVPYAPISDEVLKQIIRLQLDRVGHRIRENHGIPFAYSDEVVALIATRCTEVESGARTVDAILTNTVLPEISRELLSRFLEGKKAARVHVGVTDGSLTYAFD
ncbi:MAG: type VI secretion system ATPase TssH [Sedimentisphaerales bacterium]|nr:type VI secretion system ATPase TssH [Sedimentisphaerales bacterium]